MQCGAKTRQGPPCQSPPVKGRSRCRMHGGKTLVGAANGWYRTGRYSQYLPARMAAAYKAAKTDPELLNLTHEIALLDARLADLLQRVETGESGALWGTLHQEWQAFQEHRAAGDIPRMHLSIGHLDHLMARAHTDHLAWAEISDKLEQRRKLVESEQKRLLSMRQLITQEQALLLMGAVTDVITRNVPDKHVLSQIVVELQQLMTRDQVPVYGEATG